MPLLMPVAHFADTSSFDKTGLQFWLPMEEASGTRFDAHTGGIDFSIGNANDPVSTTGKVGNAIDLSAGSRFLKRADEAAVSVGDSDWCFTGWFKLTSKPSSPRGIISQFNSTTLGSFALFWDNSTDRILGRLYGSGTLDNVIASSFGAPVLNTWHHFVFGHIAATSTLYIRIDGGTTDTKVTALTPLDTTVDVLIGTVRTTTWYWSGALDEIAYWKRQLTDAEELQLYQDEMTYTDL